MPCIVTRRATDLGQIRPSKTRSTSHGRSPLPFAATPVSRCLTRTPKSVFPLVSRSSHERTSPDSDFAGLRDWFDPDADDPMAAGLESLQERSPEGAALRDRLYRSLRLKNYEFNAHGVETNQRYVSSATLEDKSTDGMAGRADVEQWSRDPELFAQPSCRPGAKLPHVWLVGRDGRRRSTLDVVGDGKFSVVTGLAGHAWQTAAESLDLAWLRTVVIGSPGAADPYGEWWAVREIEEAGVLLVRPDGHIAWRHSAAIWDVDAATRLLSAALTQVLGNEVGRELGRKEKTI